MRKVEYRAWDKKEKRMISFQELIERTNLREFYDDSINPFREMTAEYNKYREYMQYTGLKDENGVKIYEGDIVLNRVTDLSGGELKMCEIIGVVKVSRGMTYVVGKQLQYEEYELESSTNYNCLLLSPEIFKVITNIYDNPELIKHS